jgi:hypothetical protein
MSRKTKVAGASSSKASEKREQDAPATLNKVAGASSSLATHARREQDAPATF